MKRFIFINIPKNASTSLYMAFKSIDKLRDNIDRFKPMMGVFHPRHVNVEQIAHKLGDNFLQGALVIGCIRNPYARIVSAYEFSKSRQLWRLYKNEEPSFQEFVKVYCNMAQEDIFFHAWTQTKWLSYKDEIRADIILEFERLKEDYEAVAFEFELDLPQLSRLNGTTHGDWESYYDSETSEMVRKAYSEDFENFNYSEEI